AREGGEEDLYPRRRLPAVDVRQGIGGVQGRQDLAHVRSNQFRPRRDGRRPAVAGRCPAAGFVRGRPRGGWRASRAVRGNNSVVENLAGGHRIPREAASTFCRVVSSTRPLTL